MIENVSSPTTGESGLSSFLSVQSKNDEQVKEPPAPLVGILDSPEDKPKGPSVSPKIQDGIVAFIDILGTSALMNSVDKEGSDDKVAEDVYLTTIGMVEAFQSDINDMKKSIDGIKDMVISDSFVIAVPYTKEAICRLIDFLAKFQYKCLSSFSQSLRGAVSKGKIIGNIPENRIIGSAFISAHETEKRIALFPRIVIDSKILEDASLQLNKDILPIAIDKDGIFYIDFIKSESHDLIIDVVNRARRTHKDKPDVLQKWNWLRTFLEQKNNMQVHCCKSPSKATLPPK